MKRVLIGPKLQSVPTGIHIRRKHIRQTLTVRRRFSE